MAGLLIFSSCFGPLDPFNPPPDQPAETGRPDDTGTTDNPQNTTFPAGMVAYWKCEDSSSSDKLLDELGNHDGIIAGGRWEDGLDSGRAIFLDAIKEDYIRIENDTIFNFGTGDFTVSLWVKPRIDDISTDSTPFVIISKGVSLETGYTLGIYEQNNRFTAMVGNREPLNTDTLATPYGNAWYHCVMLRRAGTVELWINGNMSHTYSSNVDVSTQNPLFIGKDASAVPLRDMRLFTGTIDEIKIFNKAWSSRDISSEYNRLK